MSLGTSDRVIAAMLVVLLLAAQTWWMGRAVILLSGGLIIAYGIWAFAGWSNDATAVLPVYLLAIAVQCLHFTEEYLTDFQRQFPKLMGGEWSDAHFVTFNMVWLAVFVMAGLGVYREVRVAYLFVIFLALIGGVGNGASHLLLSAASRRYFPGAVTAIWEWESRCLCGYFAERETRSRSKNRGQGELGQSLEQPAALLERNPRLDTRPVLSLRQSLSWREYLLNPRAAERIKAAVLFVSFASF